MTTNYPGIGTGAMGVWATGVEVADNVGRFALEATAELDFTGLQVHPGEFELEATADVSTTAGSHVVIVLSGSFSLEGTATVAATPWTPIASGSGQIDIPGDPPSVSEFAYPAVAEYDEQRTPGYIDEIGPDAEVDAGREAE